MFNLYTQASSITTALGEISSLSTVGFVDQDDESMRRPAELPAAFVALDKVGQPDGKPRLITAPLTWVVIVRSKEVGGPGGCLSMVDLVIDKLHGLYIGDDIKQLSVEGVVFFEKRDGTVSYAVRFKTTATGAMSGANCS